MSTIHILQTMFEILFASALIYGFCNEDKVIAWEQETFAKIKEKCSR